MSHHQATARTGLRGAQDLETWDMRLDRSRYAGRSGAHGRLDHASRPGRAEARCGAAAVGATDVNALRHFDVASSRIGKPNNYCLTSHAKILLSARDVLDAVSCDGLGCCWGLCVSECWRQRLEAVEPEELGIQGTGVGRELEVSGWVGVTAIASYRHVSTLQRNWLGTQLSFRAADHRDGMVGHLPLCLCGTIYPLSLIVDVER